MTKRLFLSDSYLKECGAHVLSCKQAEGGYEIILDQTVLFPTGGGQPHDTGYIGGVRIKDVFEREDVVVHLAEAALPVDTQARVTIDWPRRFDLMQQHSGEHVLSFAAKDLFDAANVGFHMAETYCTADFEVPLDESQIKAIEQRTNELIWANLPVQTIYVTAEELEGLALRKKAKGLSGSIRVISMPGGDSCTCCGTHVAHSGEIGLVKVVASEHYKGGERVTFVCGARALRAAQQAQETMDSLARVFSCGTEAVCAAAEKQRQDLAGAKRDAKQMANRLMAYLSKEALEQAPLVHGVRLCVLEVELDAAYLKQLGQRMCADSAALAFLLAKGDGVLQYVLCCSENVKLDMGELMPAANAALNGRGGGRGTLAQGSAKQAAGVPEALTQLANYFTQVLKNR